MNGQRHAAIHGVHHENGEWRMEIGNEIQKRKQACFPVSRGTDQRELAAGFLKEKYHDVIIFNGEKIL
jgi:hypothetical protein